MRAGILRAAVAVSAPVDLMAAGDALGHGFNLLYARHFLATMKRKSMLKLARFPGLFDGEKLRAANTLRAFDDLVTAPLHGYRNTDDYWTRASSKPLLRDIAVPTLLVNARNDPFLPQSALPQAHEVSAAVTIEFPEAGGHAGFVAGTLPGHLGWLPQRILGLLRQRLTCHNSNLATSILNHPHVHPLRNFQGLRHPRHRRPHPDAADRRNHRPRHRLRGQSPQAGCDRASAATAAFPDLNCRPRSPTASAAAASTSSTSAG